MPIPNQKTSLKKKDYKFARENSKFFLSKSGMFRDAAYTEMEMCYRAYFGELIKGDYKYVLNPFNTDDVQYQQFPARLRNYNIIAPIINAKIGEASKRPFSPTVVVVNSDVENEITRQINKAIKDIAAQKLVNEAANMGIDLGIPAKQPPTVEEAVTSIKTTYRDERAIVGQEALNILVYENKLHDFFQGLRLDYEIVGRFITYKEVVDDKVKTHKVSPLDYWCYGGGYDSYDGSTKFLEDKDAHIWRRKMSLHQIITAFPEELMEMVESDDHTIGSKTKLDYLIEKSNNGLHSTMDFGRATRIPVNEYMDDNANNGSDFFTNLLSNTEDYDFDLFYTVWKTLVKVGKLIYIDEGGVIQEMNVDEDYVLNPEAGDLDIDWVWTSKFWFTITETDENGIIIKHGAVEPSRQDLINTSECKSPFNGMYRGNFRDKVYSDVMTGLPYQTLYNVYHYNREITINKNKDKLTILPKGLFALPEYGKDPITAALYYGAATSIMFFDETKPNAAAIIQAIKAIDMSLGTYIDSINSILASVRDEWWEAVGFNRQRLGETYASDGKAVTEQALIRSSIISAEDERKFDMFIESECTGLLELSKYAWKSGKRGMYISSDGREIMYNIDGQIHLENVYGLYVKNSIEEFEKMEKMHRVIELGAQKGNVSAWAISEALDAKSFAKLKQIAEKHEKIEKEYQKSIAMEKEQIMQNITKMTEEGKAADRESKELIVDKQVAGDIEVALIEADVDFAKMASQESIASMSSSLDKEVEGKHNEVMNDMVKNRLAERDMRLKETLGNAKIANDVRNTDIKEKKLSIDRMKAARPKNSV